MYIQCEVVSQPNTLSATRSEGEKCTLCIFTKHCTQIHQIRLRCFVCCAMQLSVKAVYLCLFTAVLWCRGIHLYLIWSGTMCERGATFHKNGGTTTHWRGFAPGRNQNHYTTIYHHHYITLPLHYITLDYTTLPWHHHISISSSSAQRPPTKPNCCCTIPWNISP